MTLRLAAVALAVCVGAAAVRADERVDITATDGVQLVGELAGTAGPGVVLVSAEHTTRDTWSAVARTLAGRGFRTLRFDLRGHGESSGPVDPAASDRDVEGAVRYLLGRKIRPVFLVAAGSSGNPTLVAATRVPVAGVAAESADGAVRAIAERAHGVPVRSTDEWKRGDARGAAIYADPVALEALVRFLNDPKAPPR